MYPTEFSLENRHVANPDEYLRKREIPQIAGETG